MLLQVPSEVEKGQMSAPILSRNSVRFARNHAAGSDLGLMLFLSLVVILVAQPVPGFCGPLNLKT